MNLINPIAKTGSEPLTGSVARAAALGVCLAMTLCSVGVQAAHAETKKPGIAATDTKQAALLAEIRLALARSGKYSATEIEGVIAELRNKSVEEIKAMADFSGAAATGANRLIAGSAGDARDRAGELTGRSGTSGTAGTASQNAVNQALTPGINDTRGRTSASSCNACTGTPEPGFMGSKTRNGADQVESDPIPTPQGATRVDAANGDTIFVFKDKSVGIVRKNGVEYLNSEQRLVDRSGAAKEPRPDNDKSGGFTAADVRRVAALLGSKSEPDPNSTNGDTGGGVNGTRANRTGTVGLYTESATGTYTSKADVQDIIRISVEKLQGPQVGK